jgi:hypothetical protein
MPFVLIFVGLVLVIAAIEGTEQALGAQLKKDFSGQGSFLLWAAAIVAVGSIGYVPELKKFSDTFLVLLLVSLLFSNPAALGSIASEIQSAAASPAPEQAADASVAPGAPSSTSSTSSTSSGSMLASIPVIGGLLGGTSTGSGANQAVGAVADIAPLAMLALA